MLNKTWMGMFLFLFLSCFKVSADTNEEGSVVNFHNFTIKKVMVDPFSLPEGYYMAEISIFDKRRGRDYFLDDSCDENQLSEVNYHFVSFPNGLNDTFFIPSLNFQETDQKGEYHLMKRNRNDNLLKVCPAEKLSLSYKVHCKVANLSIEGTQDNIFKSLFNTQSNNTYAMKFNFLAPAVVVLENGKISPQAKLDISFVNMG